MGSGSSTFNRAELVVPMNEQDRMMKTVKSGMNPMVQAYLATMIHPKMNQSRIPDSFTRPTALVRSSTTLDIPIFLSASQPDLGRFSAAIQPTLGSISSPSSYKVALAVGNGGPWDNEDFGNSASYAGVLNGKDVRLDQQYFVLTQPPIGDYNLFNSSGVTPQPYITTSTAPYEKANFSSFQYNTPGIQLQFFQTGHLGNRWKLPIGQYNFNFVGTTADTFSATATLSVVVGNSTDLQKDETFTLRSAGNTMTNFFAKLTVAAPVTVELRVPLTTVGATYTNAMLVITPTVYSAATQVGTVPFAVSTSSIPSGESGIVQSLRTVGMSVLATYTGPLLTNGGNIACAYVPGSTLQSSYFTNAPLSSTGAYQNWENLSMVPGSYNGPISQGTYGWWSAEDNEDLEFKVPDSISLPGASRPPSIIVSGQYAPGPITQDQTQTVIRLEVTTVYEVLTTSQLWASVQCVGSQHYMDQANSVLAQQPHCMANADHMQWMKDFWGGVKKGIGLLEAPAKMLYENRAAFAPLLSALV